MKRFLMIVGVAILFLLAACANQEDVPVLNPELSLISEMGDGEDTFSRHLQDILRFAGEERPSQHAEFEQQLSRLHEFAATLNAGGTELSDLRVTRAMGFHGGSLGIWDEVTGESRNVTFEINFTREEDANNTELIAEMLEFVNINAEDIWITSFGEGFSRFDFPDYLTANAAVYQFALPILRLHEFATNINANTTYYHEVVITSIWDNSQHSWLSLSGVPEFSPLGWDGWTQARFSVGLSTAEHLQNEELINEILDFAGLTRVDVHFEVRAIDSNYVSFEFLRVNAELAELYQQWQRLQELMELMRIRTTRRGIVMDTVINGISPANRGTIPFYLGDGRMWDMFGFNVSLSSQTHVENEQLIQTILTYTGISPDNIDVETDRFYTGWTRSRHSLNPQELESLEALEAYKEIANAPFWQNRDLHDPVIVSISLPLGAYWDGDRSGIHSPYFTLHLYDPDLLDLTRDEFDERTATLKAEISAATGVEDFKLDVAQNPLW